MIRDLSAIHRRRGALARLLAAVALTASFAGCSVVTEPERPCPDDPSAGIDDMLGLSFQVSTAVPVSRSHMASRADDSGHPEEGSDYTMEDEINLNDFGFFIFAGSADDADGDLRLLYKNTAVTQPASEMSMTGSLGDYTVNLDLPNATVEQLLGEATGDDLLLSPSGNRSLKIRIAIIANSNGRRGEDKLDYFDDLKQIYGSNDRNDIATFADFAAIAGKLQFTPVAKDYFENLQIPMYGLSDEIILTEPAMYWSRPDDRLIIGEISLLRAMTKLRLVDNIAGKTGGYPNIAGASVSYAFPTGYVTPKYPVSYINGNQIHSSEDQTAGTSDERAAITLWDGKVVNNSLIGLLPVQGLVGPTAPVVTITVQIDADNKKDYTVDLSDTDTYEVIAQQWGDKMLRNHVYTLEVTSVTVDEPQEPIKLDLNYMVCPWSKYTINIPPFE